MNNIEKFSRDEQQEISHISAKADSTIIINYDNKELVGIIENKSDHGLDIKIPESLHDVLIRNKKISLTYSTSYGLVNQNAEISRSAVKSPSNLHISVNFIEVSNAPPTPYQKLWKNFIAAETPEDVARLWLSLQCAMLDGVVRGVVVLAKADNSSFEPVSLWPSGQHSTLGLTEIAEQALQLKQGVLKDEGQYNSDLNCRICYIGLPLQHKDKLYGVVAIESIVRADSVMPVVMRQLQWGTAWIELSLRRIEAKKYTPESQQLVSVLTLTALSLEYESFQAAATAVTTELATLLKCERTSVGFLKGNNIQVRALSHSADFSKKSKLIQNIGLAMDEAMDQQVSLVYPPVDADKETVYVLRNHEALTHGDDIVNVCTIPFSMNNHIYGAMTLERSSDFPFNKKTIELCETIASIIGPVLEAKRKEDRWLITKAWSSLKHFFKKLLGPAHAVLKLASLLITAFVIFCFVAAGDYRISADTYLEGKIQRVIVTPFDGYINEAYVRAGDVVRKNTPLVSLDDTELALEKIKLNSQKEQYTKEYRNALGENDRSKVSVLNAQIGQVEAQLKLTNTKLERAKIEAPFDGVIISGDLSHSLGAPTQRGEILFEIAPLDAYRIILEVDERDISYIKNGQEGELVLAGYSNDIMPFHVTKITPVSESKEGRTYFRIEGELKNKHDFLRPGMSGVGKVMIDERKLVWIWTKNLVDWLRLTFWTWWPAGL